MTIALPTDTDSPVYDLPDDVDMISRANAAAGFLELAMPEDSLAEVESLTQEQQQQPALIHLKLIALMGLRRYEDAACCACDAIQKRPEIAEFYIHAGAAFTALQRPEEARYIWDSAPENLQRTGFFHFNLAWCELESGNLKCAEVHLKKAIQLDPAVRDFAVDDPRMKRLLK